MHIRIDEKLNKRVRDVSKRFGVDERQVVRRALLFYLDAVQKEVELRKELDAWDRLSDEALALYEKGGNMAR